MGRRTSLINALRSVVGTAQVKRPRYIVEELEERVLFSADDPLSANFSALTQPIATVVRTLSVPDINRLTQTAVQTPSQPTNIQAIELIVLDERVEQIELLKADFQAQIASGKALELVVIGRQDDAFLTISAKLSELNKSGQSVSALHLIGHGDDAGMQLGSTGLTQQSFTDKSATLASWRTMFSADADILIYGCDFAQTEAGQALSTKIAELTGTDIAASTDLTGSNTLGGNWTLEFQTGNIEASLAISITGQARYDAVMALGAVGSETRVNSTTAGAQVTNPTVNAVAVANSGDYVVVFTDPANANDILFQRFNAAGVAQGGNTLVNTTTGATAQQNPTIAMDAATGDFIIAWDGSGAGDTTGIFYRRFNASGTAADATEKIANTVVVNTQARPAIAMNSLSNFYIAWTDAVQDGSGNGVYVRQFDATGAIGASEIRVNTTTAGSQTNASIATAPGKSVVVAWDGNGTGDATGVFFKTFNTNLGTPGVETLVNTGLVANTQARPSIDMNSNGNFVIGWETVGVDANLNGVAIQRYNSSGVAQGTNTLANTFFSSDQYHANVALADDDTFVATWVSSAQDGSGLGVYGQAFTANGSKDGNEFRINTTTSLNQTEVSLAYNGTQAIAVWSGEGRIAAVLDDAAGIYSQRFVRTNILVTQSGSTTTEAGGTASFSVALSVAPTANVTIAISSLDTTEGNVSTSSLTFTPLNWNIAQIVTITGVNDSFVDPAKVYTVGLGAATSLDTSYNGIDPTDLSLTNIDDDLINTLVVTTTADNALDLSSNTSSIEALYANPGSDGLISLREAILAANNTLNGTGGADRIEFQIAGAGIKTIAPTTALPQITDGVIIDGFTQTGASLGNLTSNTPHNLTMSLSGASANSSVNAGFDIRASSVTIRGFNIQGWAGNASSVGIRIDSANNALIEGNYIGTDITGTVSAANQMAGILVVSSANATIRDNLISSNNQFGISVSGILSTGTKISANLIGTDKTGLIGLGNISAGIDINSNANNTTVGGAVAVNANVIAFNGTGVSVLSGTQNAILGNRIERNSGLGIDLGISGVDINDVGDLDSGANDLQNYPVNVTAQIVGTDLVLNAQMLSAEPNRSFRIEFFSNPLSQVEVSNHGEGTKFLGFINVLTDSSGNASISTTLLGAALIAPSGSKIALTATRDLGGGAFGGTSEFSLNAAVGNAPSITLPATPPSIAEGANGAITGLLITDIENDLSSLSVSVSNGMLNVNLSAGATISLGANNSAAFTLIGSQSQINSAIATLMYQGVADFNGSDSLNLTAKDSLGFSASTALAITITPVNSAPAISVPVAVQTVSSEAIKIFSIANGNAIQISDVDAGAAPVELSLTTDTFASFSFSTVAGLSFSTGDGIDDSVVIVRGTVAALNTALNGLAFTAHKGTLIDPTLAIAINDLGNTGSGTALTRTASVAFKVYGVELVDIGSRVTTEAGGSYSLGLRLRNAPTATVSVSIGVSPPSGSTVLEATSSTNSITFTSANWNVVQTVAITGVDDLLDDGDRAYIVSVGPLSSADPNYAIGSTTTANFTNLDNDTFNTVVVTTALDVLDGNTSSLSALLSNMGADGKISLREAILASNTTPNSVGGADRIEFNLGAGQNHTITLTSLLGALPSISDAVILDTSSDPDYALNGGRPVVTLDGVNAGVGANGLTLSASADRTTISGFIIRRFSGDGIKILAGSDSNTITNNFIGRLDRLGADPGVGFENQGQGVNVLGASNLISANLIKGNLGAGVAVTGILAQNNSLLTNIIRNNGGLAIDLGATGITPNDTLDADVGANSLQNTPVLVSATISAGSVRVSGTLSSVPGNSYRIQFFKAIDADPLGSGEAGEYIGFVDVTTDGVTGIVNFSSVFTASISNTDVITASATRIVGATTFETSEFSANIAAKTPGVLVTPNTGLVTTEAGGTASFSVVLSAAPTADVTILLSITDATEASLSQTSVTFTVANWMTPQAVTITGLDDTFVDGNVAYTVVTSNANSTDSNYNNLVVNDVSLSNTDNDTINRIIVDTTADSLTDALDGDTSSIEALYSNKGADGKISLREAIRAANSTLNGIGGADIIQFNLSGGGLRTINLTRALPTISDAVTIDGQSLAGFNLGTTMVAIDGNSAGAGVNGLTVAASNSQINGLRITNFNGAGIAVLSGTGNFINTNLITSNVGLAIDLGLTGEAINDPLDADTGANNLQNSPQLAAVSTNGSSINIVGQIRTTPNSFYRIQFFANPTQHSSGTGQAVVYIGSTDVSTDAAGIAQFNSTFINAIPSGYSISATASKANATFTAFSDTSEFSRSVVSQNKPVLYADPNTLGYVENAPGAAIFTNAVIASASATTLDSAVISFQAGFQAGRDSISWTPVSGLIGTYDSGTGVFTITGTASLANYVTALNSLQYSNSSNNPDTTLRQFNVVINSASISNSRQFSLAVIAVNDPPQLITNTGLTLLEGATQVIPSASLTANDDDIADNRLLQYQVTTATTQGYLQKSTNAGVAILSFTQGDLDDGLIQYVHNAGEISADSFTFTVSDSLLATLPQTFAIAITPVNDAPVASTSGSGVTYTENGAAVNPMLNVVLSDADNTNLVGATITLTSIESADQLSFTNTGLITGVFDNLTKTLTLSGSASVSAYQAAIRSVTFSNSSDQIALTQKNFRLQVSDGNLSSTRIQELITLINVNDTPFQSRNTTSTVTEGGTLTITPARLQFLDPDNSPSQITYSVLTAPINGHLELNTNPNVTISTFTQFDINSNRVVYIHNAGETIADSFIFSVSDGAGGTTASRTFNINVTPLDDLATITLTNFPLLYTENNAGVAIASGVSLADPDGPNLNKVTVVISTAYVPTEDVLSVSGSIASGLTSNWDALLGTLTISGSATIAQYQAALSQVQYRNLSDSPTTVSRTLSFALTNANGAQGTASKQLSVAAINDAPTITSPSSALSVDEDTNLILSGVNAISISDIDAGSSTVRVTLTAGNLGIGATLTLSQITGISFQLGTVNGTERLIFEGSLASINAALDGLIFNAGLNFNGSTSIAVTVNDKGNSGAGGAQSATATLAINVASINDIPIVQGTLSAGVQVGGSVTLFQSMLSATDVDIPSVNLVFNITQAPLHGRIESTQAAGVALLSFSLNDVIAGRIRYVHDGSLAPLDSFKLEVSDGIGASSIATFGIATANNPPVLSPGVNPAVQYIEQATAIPIAPALVVIDTDSPSLLGATVTIVSGAQLGSDRLVFVNQNNIIGTLDAQGALTLSGLSSRANYEAALRSVSFRNTSDTPTTTSRTIAFTISDGATISNVSTVQVNVVAVNDAPVVFVSTGTRLTEDTQFAATNEIQVSDADIGTGLQKITLSSTQGLISLTNLTGLSFLVGNGNANGIMTFTGTQAAVNSALNSLTFTPTLDINGSISINVAVSDFGDVNGLNVQSGSGILQIDIDPVNDAPVISGLPAALLTYVEASTPIAVMPTVIISDVDSNQLTNAIVSISPGSYLATEDRLGILNAQGLTVNWDQITGQLTLTGNADRSVYEAALHSVIYENTSASPNTRNRVISVSVSDESLTTTSANVNIAIVRVNNPAVVSLPNTTGYTENSAAINISPTLTVTDVDSTKLTSAKWIVSASYLQGSDSLIFANTAQITGAWNASTGTLTLTGLATIADYETALRDVRFQTTTENPIALTRNFTLEVVDDGGAMTSTTLSGFALTAVNDAPIVSLTPTFNSTEDVAAAIFSSSANLPQLSDIDANQTQMTISLQVNRGSLAILSNANLTSVQNPSPTDLILVGTLAQLTSALSNITYLSELNFNGSVQLQITLQDSSGATDLKSAQLQVAAVNDAPTLSLPTTTPVIATGSSSVDVLTSLAIRDIDSPLLESAVIKVATSYATGDKITVISTAKVQSIWDASTGTLTLSGSASVAEYQSILQTLQFSTTSTNLSARTIDVALKDSSGASVTLDRVVNFNSTTTTTPPNPTTIIPPNVVPPVVDPGTTTTGTTNTGPAPSSNTGATQSPSAALGAAQITRATTITNPLTVESLSQTSNEDATLGRDIRNRTVDNGRGAVQNNGVSDLTNTKVQIANIAQNKDSDSDLRIFQNGSRSDNRASDISARLLQVATRENSISNTTLSNALKITLTTGDNEASVNIKVSKADQLAVDLLSLPVQSGGVVVSAAVLWWITRAGGLLTALLTSLPSWQHFDPLPILTSTDGREDEDWGDENVEDEKELDAVLSQ
jgi:Domain of unknown function (DUF4347)/Cadherin-like/Right handed beta helix region